MSEDTQLTDNRTHERAKKGLVYFFYFFVLTSVDVLSWPLLDRLGHRAWAFLTFAAILKNYN